MSEVAPDRESAVRTEVRKLLEASPAFAQLPPEQRRALAKNLVTVGAFLADPAWIASLPAASDGTPEARALTDLRDALAERAPATVQAADDVAKRLAQAPEQVGKDFRAGAVREGVRAFRELVDAVDFPQFVSGLISGVFQSIVDATIQQMDAYTEMLAAVAKSVDQFAQDHISDAQARDYAASQHPTLLRVVEGPNGARLEANPDADLQGVAQRFALRTVSTDDEAQELALVNAAKLEMARSRQQLMATMVLLGMQRIVVTDGRINAKVVFDLKASDEAQRHARASLHDERLEETKAFATAALPWGAAGGARSSRHKTTVRSSVDDKSDSKAELKAQLAGEVRVNFRSETFPLERLADAGGIALFQQKAQPLAVPGQPAAPAPTASPAPPARS